MNKKEFCFLIFLETLLSSMILLGLAKFIMLMLSLYIIYATIKVGSRGFSISWADFKKSVKELLGIKNDE
jgi:hypothetical protein